MKNQPEVFLHKVLLRRPRIMDVHAFGSRTSAQKTSFSCAPSSGVRAFGPGRPPAYSPGPPRDIPPKNFLFGLLFRFGKMVVCFAGGKGTGRSCHACGINEGIVTKNHPMVSRGLQITDAHMSLKLQAKPSKPCGRTACIRVVVRVISVCFCKDRG